MALYRRFVLVSVLFVKFLLQIINISSAYRPDGSARGFAHVEYKSLDSAVKAFESASEEPIYIGDRDARVDFAPPRAEIVKEPFHKLYFYDFRGDEAALREAVQEFDSSIVSTYFRAYSFILSLFSFLTRVCPFHSDQHQHR